MKLTYALLRKQRTHNLRHIVRTLLMKLAPGANFINEFTTCFCLKNIVRSSYIKNRVSSNYWTLRTSYFLSYIYDNYLGVAADIFVLHVTNLLLSYQGCCIAHGYRGWRAKNRQRFKYLESTIIKTTLYTLYGLPKCENKTPFPWCLWVI